jgi:hypothetical protein
MAYPTAPRPRVPAVPVLCWALVRVLLALYG